MKKVWYYLLYPLVLWHRWRLRSHQRVMSYVERCRSEKIRPVDSEGFYINDSEVKAHILRHKMWLESVLLRED